MRVLILFVTILTAMGCSGGANIVESNAGTPTKSGPLPVAGFEIVKAYPHDPKAFTQGLFFHQGFLYESTGQEGFSSLRKVEIETGKVVQKSDLPKTVFAEGATLLGDKVYQLTWQDGIARVFNINDFSIVKEFSYQGEGWGLTTDGTNLFMTDRTHVMRVLNPETFKSIKMLAIMREDGRPLMNINELEYVKGEIWANIWHSEQPEVLGKPNYIARIDPQSGKLLGWINLAGISPDDQSGPDAKPGDPRQENALNGIAYDAAGDRIFVTGKNWKKLYEIKLKPQA
ncbi:MAG: glutaminyl-peptide cyclotransferase [Pyrinomonadaceae bacterium]